MAQPDPIIHQPGPLPISQSVTTGSVGPATLVVAGSAWTKDTDCEIGFDVIFEGEVVGTSSIYSNGPSTHRATVPIHVSIELDKPFSGDPPSPPTYTVELRAMNSDTETDLNDNFQVTLIQ